MKKNNAYLKTQETYELLGKAYVESVSEGAPKELYDFISLLKKGANVLEIGCAGGRDSKILSDAGFTVTGIDIVDTFLAISRKSTPNAMFLKMNVLELEFADDSFDAVWASAVLLHLKKQDIQNVLHSVNKIIKLGGYLYVGVKEGVGEGFISEKLSKDNMRYFSLYSKKELEKIITDTGFSIESSAIVSDDLNRTDIKWIRIFARKIN